MDPMEQIKATFFQECDELLADLESRLLALEAGDEDGDTINAAFRAVHSVKGGAGAFGLDDLVRFAHVFESTMDEMRSGRLAADGEAVKVLLRSADMLADLVAAARGEGAADDARAAALAEELAALIGGGAPTAAKAEPAAAAPAVEEGFEGLEFTPVQLDIETPGSGGGFHVRFRPLREVYAKANDALLLLRELARLGPCEVTLDESELPALDALDPLEAYLAWTVEIGSGRTEADVREVFEFVDGYCDLAIEAIAGAQNEPPADVDELLKRLSAGDPPAPEAASAAAPEPVSATPAPSPLPMAAVVSNEASGAAAPSEKAAPAGQTIRVDLERVDRLIDLVGELVINQAMLAQRVVEAGIARSSTVAVGLDELEQLTREIQDSVMAIRAQPVKSVFQRIPRLVREIAAMTGKPARLVTEGEGTEVDKTVIERLSDPITHMIRNAIDHGLESPEKRAAAGKPEEGVVRLSAQHRSGRIIIEVSDDGGGINRERVKKIAVDKGLIDGAAQLTDEEVDNLIFLPGFSTADTVSDISGRGVGMDVVRRSIQELGGRISIASRPGEGSTFTMSLPLTLAVLDGMVLASADQTLVAPLTSIIETLLPEASQVKQLGQGWVLDVRGAYVPLVDVAWALGYRATRMEPTSGVVLLVESDVGGRAALLVDAIQGQRQVVIKSLEANYQRVEGIAAATILGDGRVALILDVDAVVACRGAPAQFKEAS